MSKSILVLEERPEDCGECILCQLDGVYVCRRTRQILNKDVYEKTINRYCPLKPVPQKNKYDVNEYATVDFEDDITLGHYMNMAWNECIDEILGGEE